MGGRVDFGSFRCNVYYSTEVLTFKFVFRFAGTLVEFDPISIFSIPLIISGILFSRVTRSDTMFVVWGSIAAVCCVFWEIFVISLVSTSVCLS